MSDQVKKMAAVSIRPTHGTATQVQFNNVVPREKRAKEEFWVAVLLGSLSEFADTAYAVVSNPDDSHGKDDVLIELHGGGRIGVQVTELTWELERARQAQRDRFIGQALHEIESRGLEAEPPIVANCLLSYEASRKTVDKASRALADVITDFLATPNRESRIARLGPAQVVLATVEVGTTYSRQHRGVAVDCSLDSLPRSLDVYLDAARLINEKKADSRSDWLVIWSLQFWRDRHWLGERVMDNLRIVFANSAFERVYFVESIDGDGFFEANLHVHPLKVS